MYMRSEPPDVGVVFDTCAAPAVVVRPPRHTNSTFTLASACVAELLRGCALSLTYTVEPIFVSVRNELTRYGVPTSAVLTDGDAPFVSVTIGTTDEPSQCW